MKAFAKNRYGTVYGNRVSFVVGILPPSITFKELNNLTSGSVEATFYVSSDGGSSVTEKGVYLDTFPVAGTTGKKFTTTSQTDTFKVTISGLRESTRYYFTTYGINKAGTLILPSTTVLTQDLPQPEVITLAPTIVTRTSMIAGGKINAPAGNTIMERGVRYSPNNPPVPSPYDPQTSDGTGAGTFTSSLTPLNPGTKYYLRAYARTPAGIFYGATLTATTAP